MSNQDNNQDNQAENPTITAHITSYSYYVRKPDEAKQYEELRAKLKAAGNNFFNVIDTGNDHHINHTGPIELEIKQLFNNQWNASIPGREGRYRVFDWYEGIQYNNGRRNENTKRGHYITLTPEIKALRDNRHQCGYCGHQEDFKPGEPHPEFCTKCLGSEYLKKGVLKLLRLKPVSFKGDRPPLTDEELAELMPRHIEAQTKTTNAKNAKKRADIEAQTKTTNAKNAKKRADIEAKHNKDIKLADEEYNGFIWLFDKDINTDNVIFYRHTGRFGFGWKSPIDEAVKPELLKQLEGFPFPYDIK